ncbi:ABC transporter permease [Polaribacter sp. NJDZ03]|uniref:ABC transporter permease n=1 Tax=Polaribacter sp. NJDZ03 TaxID=2855841 RepID=UPI001C49FCE8|nr:ABC transporter permease [Polaribacter sp. NJDZ03]
MFRTPEILSAIYKNKDKSIIAGITVAWGIMLLILLVGTGQGLQNGVKKIFSDYTVKTIEVFSGEASISDISVNKGDLITFNILDIKKISSTFNYIENISPVVDVKIPAITSERKSINRFSLKGVNEKYFNIKTLKLNKGRVFNTRDRSRKNIILGYEIAKNLFNNINCVGRIVFLNNVGYKIIGVIEKDNLFNNSGYNAYIHYENALNISTQRSFNEFILSLKSKVNTEEFQKTLKVYLSIKKGINPKDKTAFFFNNIENTLKTFNTLFNAINLFLWFIGISFLISGMLSIFNIMTVIVKDRIGEFGIRKALGATPNSIQIMVLIESLIITVVSGVIGLIVGFFLIYLINLYIEISGGNNEFLILDINKYVILSAIFLLTVSGCIAGIIPARKASEILPIEALRTLNN